MPATRIQEGSRPRSDVNNESIRKLINREHRRHKKGGPDDGMRTLLQSATDLALKGKTSFEEIMRAGYTLG